MFGVHSWPTTPLQRPNSVNSGYYHYPPPTPKLAVPYTPSWIYTPQIPFPTPAPAADDLPPLIPDESLEEEEDDPLHTPYQSLPYFPLPPPPPPGPVPPFGYVATPIQTPIHTPRRPRRQYSRSNSLLDSARMRARSETTIPIMHVPRIRVKGRPSHWRVGYRATASTKIKNCFAKPPCVSGTHTLHSLLLYIPRHHFPLLLDLRKPYMCTVFHNPERHPTTVDLYQLATAPPTHEMQLYHPLLPWFIDIHATSPSGITIYDILFQLHTALQTPIISSDYWNDINSSDDREQLLYSYHLRNDLEGGLRRIDFLGPNVYFRGLRRTREGWLIITTT